MVWNSLPDDRRAQQDYVSFKQGLKTWLFSGTGVHSALETFVTMRYINLHFPLPLPLPESKIPDPDLPIQLSLGYDDDKR